MEQAQGTSTSGNTKPDVKARNYFITFWGDYPKSLPSNASYLCTCEDSCKEGKFHGHAFIYFKNPTTLTGVKKLFGKDCHVERPHLNSTAIKYVKGICDAEKGKESRKHNIIENGRPPMDNGVHAMEQVLECNTVTQVIETMPDTYVKYRNGIKDIILNKQAKNRFYKPPMVHWIYGPTGTGKTREAFEKGARNVDYNNGFFSDWGDARIICLEELRGDIPYRTLLKLLDGYHNYYSINIKGGEKFVDLDEIYITSPYRPEDIYRQQVTKDDSIDQLLRRITELRPMGPCSSCPLTPAEGTSLKG